jgi:hypothetical protein
MEENKKVKYKGIKSEALIKLEFSGYFTARIQTLLIYFMKLKTVAEINKILEDLKTKEPADEYQLHLLTLLILIQDIEKAAGQQGLVVEEEIDADTITEN